MKNLQVFTSGKYNQNAASVINLILSSCFTKASPASIISVDRPSFTTTCVSIVLSHSFDSQQQNSNPLQLLQLLHTHILIALTNL